MPRKLKSTALRSDAVTVANIPNGEITAAKLSSTAIEDKLGYVPASAATVATQLATLVDSAPTTLDTLNELAAALGDDANFATTVTNSLAAKAPIADPTFTGNVTISSTGYLRLPIGTTAQRPGSPAAGHLRFNTSLSSLEFHTGTSWSVIGLADGSTATNASTSCKAILATRQLANLSSPDGAYWINPAGTGSYQVYCDMTTDGGGWTLVMSSRDSNSSGGTGTHILIPNRDAIIAGSYTTGDSSILSEQTMVSKALYQVSGDNILVREQGRSGWIKGTTNYNNTNQQCLNDGTSRTVGYWFNKGLPGVGGYARICNQSYSSPDPTNMWSYYNFNQTISTNSIPQKFIFMMQENQEPNNYAFLSITKNSPGEPSQLSSVWSGGEEGDQGFIVTDNAYSTAMTDWGAGADNSSTLYRPGVAGHLFVR